MLVQVPGAGGPRVRAAGAAPRLVHAPAQGNMTRDMSQCHMSHCYCHCVPCDMLPLVPGPERGSLVPAARLPAALDQ